LVIFLKNIYIYMRQLKMDMVLLKKIRSDGGNVEEQLASAPPLALSPQEQGHS